jgi:hypothetical protein
LCWYFQFVCVLLFRRLSPRKHITLALCFGFLVTLFCACVISLSWVCLMGVSTLVPSVSIASLSCVSFSFCVSVMSAYVLLCVSPALLLLPSPFSAIVCCYVLCSFYMRCSFSCGYAFLFFVSLSVISSLCFSFLVPRSPPCLPFSTIDAQVPRACLARLGCAVLLYGHSLAWCPCSEQEKHVTGCHS